MVCRAVVIFAFLLSLAVAAPLDNIFYNQDQWQELLNRNDLILQGRSLIQNNDNDSGDKDLSVPELIQKYGYGLEKHTIETEDGFILEVHRIPSPGHQPVFLQHGLLDSSEGWIINGPGNGLAYILADLGYDVWMGNSRGNTYSKQHTTLNVKSKEFWDFSFHEIGLYDIPATIKFILEETKFEKIHYIGHSQGTTSFFVMCAKYPEINEKILSMNALAPIAFMSHMKSPLVRIFATFGTAIQAIANLFHEYDIDPHNSIVEFATRQICGNSYLESICSNLIFLAAGFDSSQLDLQKFPVIMSHIPAGASLKQLVHYGQLYLSGGFKEYDYGWWKNFDVYRTVQTPSYNLSMISAPVHLHYSENDWLAGVKDVEKLATLLPNSNLHKVKMDTFNHIDYLFAIDAKTLVYDKVIEAMKYHE